jgi:hypothetical protein
VTGALVGGGWHHLASVLAWPNLAYATLFSGQVFTGRTDLRLRSTLAAEDGAWDGSSRASSWVCVPWLADEAPSLHCLGHPFILLQAD